MNDKRFTFKLLGVFLMEYLNINPKEVRKTFWHLIAGLVILIIVFRLPDFITVLK